jgi:hypothetical protein
VRCVDRTHEYLPSRCIIGSSSRDVCSTGCCVLQPSCFVHLASALLVVVVVVGADIALLLTLISFRSCVCVCVCVLAFVANRLTLCGCVTQVVPTCHIVSAADENANQGGERETERVPCAV